MKVLNSSRFLRLIFLYLLMALFSLGLWARPNVLFLSVDDLKPMLGAYGDSTVQTPNIDRLAKRGAIMLNNHCQQAICAPSRMSMFTGLRPDTTKVWDLGTSLMEVTPWAKTMQQVFKENGYQTAGAGKTMHGADSTQTFPPSWSIPYTNKNDLPYAEGYEVPAYGFYQDPRIQEVNRQMQADGVTHWRKQREYFTERNAMPSVERLDVPDAAYQDGALTVWANDLLEQFAASKEPFFLTVGFMKPHLPFVAPKKYWDLYDRNQFELAEFRTRAKNSPWIAYHNFGELKSYSDVEDSFSVDNPVPPEQQLELIHGYHACVSYVDAQIGMILAKLDELGLAENTIIVLWGDHGYHLGDHGMWNKHSNFEQATRAPLIFSAPGYPQGLRVEGPTEFVDIFPTLLELAELEAPYEMEGTSLVPALLDPTERVKEFAVSQYPRQHGQIMGYTLRNDRHRLVIWMKGKWRSTLPFNPELVEAVELYDYETDPLETVNYADDPEYSSTREELEDKMMAFFSSQVKAPAATPAEMASTESLSISNGDLIDLSTLELATLGLRFASVRRTGDELMLSFEHSPKWPSVDFFAPSGTTWDLSGAKGFDMELTNHSTQDVKTVAYITNPGDSSATPKRNGVQKDLPAGERSTIRVLFDPESYPLELSQLNSIRIFVNKLNGPAEMTLHAIRVLPGTPPAAPVPAVDVSKTTKGSVGIPNFAIEPGFMEYRFSSSSPVKDGKALQLELELSSKWPSVDFMSPTGTHWDLSAFSSVEVSLTNTGEQRARVFVYLANEGDTHQDTKRSGAKEVLNPGETKLIRIPVTATSAFNPSAVHHMRIFTGMHKAPVLFRLNSVQAVK